jgi:hypothetical protein
MTSNKQNQRQALLVIGMHRSGTSALTRVINLHGIALGTKLMEPAADNEAGFWENQHVVDLHERVLADLGSSWDDPRELREGWMDEPQTAVLLDELVELISSEFGEASMWAVKDPRLCRLLPLWLKALARMGIEPKLIFAMRDPAEVVGSLIRRNDLPAASASLMWLRHLVEPAHASRGMNRCIVGYGELLGDWRSCMARIASDLALEWPVSSQTCATEVDAHLRLDLRHQHSATAQNKLPVAWRDLLLEIYAKGLAVANGTVSWDSFESDLNASIELFSFAQPLIAELLPKSELERLQTRLNLLNAAVEGQERDATHVRQELALTHAELESARTELESIRAEFEPIRAELESARAEVESTRAELKPIRTEVESARAELESTRTEVESTRTELEPIRTEVESTRTELEFARTELESARAEIGSARAELELIKSSLSWRWTRPIRVMMRVLRNRGLSAEDRLKLKRLTRKGR